MVKQDIGLMMPGGLCWCVHASTSQRSGCVLVGGPELGMRMGVRDRDIGSAGALLYAQGAIVCLVQARAGEGGGQGWTCITLSFY